MPSFQDSAVIFFLALLLFGPKKLPELARQLGKLMGEFRRASNEFRMQMEDELRIAEQAEQQKKIAAMEAAAPVTPAIEEGVENTIAQPTDGIATDSFVSDQQHEFAAETTVDTTPLPIATVGNLNLMPPSTGLPVAISSSGSSSMSHAFDSIPHVADPELAGIQTANPTDRYAMQQAPDRSRSHDNDAALDQTTTEAPLHG